MLQPKRTKYHFLFTGRMKGLSHAGSRLNFGDFGLKSLTRSLVSAREIEAARKAIAHHTKRRAKIWVRVFTDKPITKKTGGTMGGGKGDIDFWAVTVKPGRILFEISGVPEEVAKEALKMASYKLSVRTKFIGREE